MNHRKCRPRPRACMRKLRLVSGVPAIPGVTPQALRLRRYLLDVPRAIAQDDEPMRRLHAELILNQHEIHAELCQV